MPAFLAASALSGLFAPALGLAAVHAAFASVAWEPVQAEAPAQGSELDAWPRGIERLVLPARADAAALVVVTDGAVIDGAVLPGAGVGGARAELRGALEGVTPERYEGVGLVVRGRNVTLRNLRVSGYRVGILAEGADGLVVEDVDVSDNFRQRLGSTPAREDPSDWLWPHANDRGEWLERYGAGLAVRDAADVRIRRSRARDGQNGLVLERVQNAVVHDNDFSFLSGWGIAAWRTTDSVFAHNAVDFCVRGYSHGVYNRGQDSAGFLFFEQCSRNVLAHNSATHGGDGFFGFAGSAALGAAPAPGAADPDPAALEHHRRRGNNDNVFYRNDFSHAVAHGLELTFSFGNTIVDNRFAGNAICGIWGGYSQATWIGDNRFTANGERGYGLERGGIAIEHGSENWIVRNAFEGNRCGVRLWWDVDEALSALPWTRVNGAAVRDNVIAANRFDGNAVAFEGDGDEGTLWVANAVDGRASEDRGALPEGAELDRRASVARRVAARLERAGLDPARAAAETDATAQAGSSWPGTPPIGARHALGGREAILVGEWGPWDHERAWPVRESDGAGDRWTLHGVAEFEIDAVEGEVACTAGDATVLVTPLEANGFTPYRVVLRTAGDRLVLAGSLSAMTWRVSNFAWSSDPREDPAAWSAAREHGIAFDVSGELELAYGSGGPQDLDAFPAERMGELSAVDRFGTVASTLVRLAAGSYELIVVSDDGVRVWVDDELVLDDWTWHAPREARVPLVVDRTRDVRLLVEHFELDGHALLSCRIAAR